MNWLRQIFGAVLVVGLLSGCMNLYTRCPFTDKKIEDTYQSTQETFALSYVVMFPQVLPMNESDGLVWQNIFTIPVGCLCFVDVALEGVVDTICWPYDSHVSKKHKKDFE